MQSSRCTSPAMSNQLSSHPEWSGRIRRLLERLKLAQAALAEHLGVSPATVSRWLKGSLEPSGKTYVALGNLIGSPDGIYFWERAGMEPSASRMPICASSCLLFRSGLETSSCSREKEMSQRVTADQSIAVVIPLLNLTAYGDRVLTEAERYALSGGGRRGAARRRCAGVRIRRA